MCRIKIGKSCSLVAWLLAAAAGLAWAAEWKGNATAGPAEIDKPLIAHWTFDELSGDRCEDTSGHGWHAAATRHTVAIERRRGLFGNALVLSGEHLLRTDPRILPANPGKISFSAWTRPTDLGGYREIFRKEDGNDRVLFSFQFHGTVLSLGLNVGGYVECHATIRPELVRDGRWHHCAATFDGRWMRVYLDGDEVGSLKRPGTIRAGGSAPGCIGSCDGGECFQGSLDDLRIYAAALSARQIALLHRRGQEAIEQLSGQLAQKIPAVYQRGPTFAQTLMQSRQRILEKRFALDADLAAAVVVRLKTDFPDEYARFAAVTGVHAAEFLSALDPDWHVKLAERFVEMLLEYQPLTERQLRNQTPEELRKWAEAEAIRGKLERLKAQAARFSPAWIELLLDVAPRIQFRPVQSEAVAPYMPPATPVTRNLSTDEAQAALRRDWLFQADGNPSADRIRREIVWTRRLAARIESMARGTVRLAGPLAELEHLEAQAKVLAKASPELYFQVRQVKRAILLANPVLRFEKILLVDMPYPQGSEWRHETRHRLGYMAVPGGRLLVLEGLSPAGRLTQLMPQAPLHGSFWRPDVSYDAKKVLFCFKPHNEKAFHLYEIDADGANLTQLTDGCYDDFDPIYLPDGQHILFSTTRGHTYLRCMPPTNAFVLARCDRDGKNIYLTSQNNEPDYLPSVMNDGRVIYTRWEYTDKPLWRAEKLWTVNPDGTQVCTFWGNQSVWPDVMKDVRAIPGSRRVMFTGCGHHDWFAGSLGIVDPDRGLNFPAGLTKITAELPWPEVGNGPVDPIECPDYHRSGNYRAYFSPYPLGEKDFLVSAERDGKFLLFLMDVEGNRELIYEGVNNIFHAIPLASRPRPPLIADRVAWPSRRDRQEPRDGVIYSSNVYQNAPAELRGLAKFLRVLTIEPKTYTYWYKRPYISTGPVVSIVQSEGVKRVLGTVPIESDGSVAFHAPPGKSLHFQLLDEKYHALQTMRSFVGVMPGEYRGCLGCHESHSRVPVLGGSGVALTRPPREITPPPWGQDTVSYPRYVRPVLDAYCNKCHAGNGEARKVLDLTPRPGFLDFDESYAILTGHPSWGAPYQEPAKPIPGWGIAGMLMVEAYATTDPRAYGTPQPMTRLSYRSRLIELASSGKHYDVKVDPISLARLIAWVDAMCPYNGDEEVRQIDDPVFQGVDWLAIRPRIKTAPTIIRPGPVD
ncbi:MAG: LamG-like jellyroll fold domain-containing protein [Thermoguttaceae bacterium]